VVNVGRWRNVVVKNTIPHKNIAKKSTTQKNERYINHAL
jgi:hypothetical protein